MTEEEARDFQGRFFDQNPSLEAPIRLMAGNPRGGGVGKDVRQRYVLGDRKSGG